MMTRSPRTAGHDAPSEKLLNTRRPRLDFPWTKRTAMDRQRAAFVTVAILAQGTSWAVVDTQNFLPSGPIPRRIKSQSVLTPSAVPLLLLILARARDLNAETWAPCARDGLEPWVAHLTKHPPCNGLDDVMCCVAVCDHKCMDA